MGEYRTCTKCGKSMPATTEYFHACKHGKYGLKSVCKECCSKRAGLYYRENSEAKREYFRKYREANADVIRERDKRYREENKEKETERCKRYRTENHEKVLEQKKRYRENNKEKCKESCRRFYEQHRDEERERQRLYRKEHKGERSEAQKRYRQKNLDKYVGYEQKRRSKQNALENTFTPEEWEIAKMAFGNCCAYCGMPGKMTQDHFIPVTEGGPYTAANILPACQSCNSSKNNNRFSDWYNSQPFYRKEREETILKYIEKARTK